MKDFSVNDKLNILKSYLFTGISLEELDSVLPCLGCEIKNYTKDEYLFRYGDFTSRFGLVLTGSVNIVRFDFWGNRHIVNATLPGETFGASYAAVPEAALDVSVQATEDTRVLFLTFKNVLHRCSSACSFHSKLIDNMIHILAFHNLSLNSKLSHITQHSIRDKLLSYLSDQSLKHRSPYFDIHFNRQELADYLKVDRSAMSNEMSKMRKEGLIDYNKNHFKLFTQNENKL